MKQVFLPTAFVFCALPAVAEAPRVATDILPVQSLVAQVMQGVGSPDLVVPANVSPHGHALRPSEARALQEADLVVWIGPELTPWLSEPLKTLSPGSQKLGLLTLEGVSLREYDEKHGDHDDHADDDHDDHEDHGHDHAEDDHGHDDHGDEGHDDHGHDDHGHDDHAGHDHEGTDPHAWLAPANAIVWLDGIAAALSEVDPDNAATYAANADAGKAAVLAAEAEAMEVLSGVAAQPYMTFHDAYGYFEGSFGLISAGSILIGDGTPAGAARIAELRDTVAELGVSCVFTEPQLDPGVAATVAEGARVQIVTIDPLGSGLDAGPGLYPDLLRALASDMAACLSR